MPLIKQKKQLKDGETQTDDTLVDDDQTDEELFVHKTNWIAETTKKIIEIHDFTQKIDDGDKNLKIYSPKFKLAGVDFSIAVYPYQEHDGSGFIGVFLNNYSNEDKMTSITVQEASGVERSWEMGKVKAGKGYGWTNFLSHENYKAFANVRGDVLKLEVVITLHTKADGDGWTRYVR